MAGRHLRDLISAYGERDDLKFRRAAQGIIQEEESKRHTVLARELRSLLAAGGGLTLSEEMPMPDLPVDRDSALPLAQVSRPDVYLDDLVLAARPAAALSGLTNEIRNWASLDAAGIPRRNRILLSGPPGTGKTSAASAIAAELGRPLVTARVEGLISSYLGETAANLANLFTFIASGPYVLLLDEFDSLGKKRDDPSDHGELRRVVNAVLQQIDRYAGPSLIIAATNHADVLDTALWRRFDAVVELPLPSETEIQLLLGRVVPGMPDQLRTEYAGALSGLPHAAIEYFAHWARRAAHLAGRKSANASDYRAALNEALSRRWL